MHKNVNYCEYPVEKRMAMRIKLKKQANCRPLKRNNDKGQNEKWIPKSKWNRTWT